MNETKPFIPHDKPRSWVVGVLAGLSGLTVGLIALAAAALGIASVKSFAIALFVVCWATCALSGLVFASGLITGRYANLKPKKWSEQLW